LIAQAPENESQSIVEKLSAEKRLTDRAGLVRTGPVDIDSLMPTSSTASSTSIHAALARIDLSSRSIFSIESRNAGSLVTRRMIRLCA
jgi:predicted metal-dependent enzyme (double-stranded beta helix superfamily)